MIVLLFLAGLWAGIQNALAGGGSFITLSTLILAGMSPLSANITSTVALFPGQVVLGLSSRKHASGVGAISFKALVILSVIGGAAGGLLLINTPARVFARLVPWLVLLATAVFAWGNFFRTSAALHTRMSPFAVCAAQFAIAIYGGYFGGGIGILMLAALTMAGLATRTAGATKNVLAGVMNASAVVLFAFSPLVNWRLALVLGAGAVLGGVVGGWLLQRANETVLKVIVVLVGIALTIGLFLRPV